MKGNMTGWVLEEKNHFVRQPFLEIVFDIRIYVIGQSTPMK